MSRIRANQITNQSADGAPTVQNGLVVTGVTTSTNVSVASSVTATTYYGSGANLTNITSTTINNNADNRVITGSGTANTLEGESGLTYSSNTLDVTNAVKLPDDGTVHYGVSDTAYVRGKDSTDGYLKLGTAGLERLRIDSSGRVMIGNTAAGQMFGGADDLIVGTTSGARGITIISENNTIGRLLFSDSLTSGAATYQGQVNYNHSTDTLDLRTYTGGSITLSTSNTERVTITSGGDVTISTGNLTIPDSIVHDGDTDTKIRFPAANTFTVETGSVERVNIDNTAMYLKSGYPLAFLASSGATPNIKSGGTNNQDLLLTTGSGNPTRLQVYSNGQVTMPAQAMLSMTVNSSIQSGGYMIHSGVITNNGNHYNTGNGRFTCPVAGFYYASIMVMSNASNTTMDLELHKNSNNFNNILVPYQAPTGGNYNQVSGSCIIECSANDILQFKLNSGSVYDGRHSNITFALLA